MVDEPLKEIISATVRTLVQCVPVVGSAISQAWSEYDDCQRNARVNDFFTEFAARLNELESKSPLFEANLRRMADFGRLLEDSVNAARRETDDLKRRMYPTFLVNAVLNSPDISSDERSFLLETLDSLTKNDIETLERFRESGRNRGDILTGTTQGRWATVGVENSLSAVYEPLLGASMASTAKLEARGLLVPIFDHDEFEISGTGGEWYNQYRQKAWRLMPLGRKLLNLIV